MQAQQAWEKLRAAELQHWSELLQAEQHTVSLLRNHITNLEAQAAAQQDKIDQAQAAATAADTRSNTLTEQCARYEAHALKMQQRIGELSQQIKRAQAEHEQLTASYNAQEGLLTVSRSACAEVLAEAGALKERARSADAARQAAVRQLTRVQAAAAGLCGQVAEVVSALEVAVADKESAEAEVAVLSERHSAQQGELQALRAKSALLQSALSAEKSRAETAAASMQTALQSAFSDLGNCRTLLTDTQVCAFTM